MSTATAEPLYTITPRAVTPGQVFTIERTGGVFFDDVKNVELRLGADVIQLQFTVVDTLTRMDVVVGKDVEPGGYSVVLVTVANDFRPAGSLQVIDGYTVAPPRATAGQEITIGKPEGPAFASTDLVELELAGKIRQLTVTQREARQLTAKLAPGAPSGGASLWIVTQAGERYYAGALQID